MYKLQFTLKQHTPLIHFQHEQDGATLRATEVKPKLDRFIIGKLGSDVPKEWFVSKDHPALNYKLRIEAGQKVQDLCTEIEKDYESNSGRMMPEKFPTFFGLMGEENKGKKEFVMYESVSVTIVTMDRALYDCIKQHICTFFMQHNFGNRQSKGFGSFYLAPNDALYQTPEAQGISLPYSFEISVNPNRYLKAQRSSAFKAQYELFETINLFYASLRNGINLYAGKDKPVFYLKSMLFLYAKSLGIQWEKKKIKETFYANELKMQKSNHPNADILEFSGNSVHLMRDIFGLASDSEWKIPYNDTISKVSSEVERYRSPIHFKPIDLGNNRFRVYFDASNEDEKIYNQLFSITSKRQRGNISIKTPPQFSFLAFFKFAFSQNLNQIAQYPSSIAPKELIILQGIYRQINSNII